MSRYPQSAPRPMELEYGTETGVLVRFFNAVYAWMATGLALTGVVAWWVSTRPDLMAQIFSGPVLLVLILAQLGLVVAISWGIKSISSPVATGLFLLYSALMGLTLSVIFVVYTQSSIASAFLVSAGTFAAFSVYGFVTKTDLTRLGSLLFMALIGLIIASIVNVFWANSTLYWIVTYAGVLIFVGLTAYDTQRLKMIALGTANDGEMASRMSVYGALVLYLDFINLFLFILRIMGNRR